MGSGRRSLGFSPATHSAIVLLPPTGFTATLTLFHLRRHGLLVVLRLLCPWRRLVWPIIGAMLWHAAPLKFQLAEQLEQQVERALAILSTTPGIEQATVLNLNDQRRLLEQWFGADVPIELLALPALIDIREEKKGFDGENLRLRLVADIPGAVLDDHTRWRRPLPWCRATFGAGSLAFF